MVAAALEFTLGLQVNKFLEGLGLSTEKLLGLVSVTESLGKVMEGVWSQIEKGAALNDLSKRTGESVATLYQLQKAFTATGVPADSLGLTLFQMQKALGGISETGESTSATFKQLGLNLHDLKQLDSGQAFQQIIAALSKLDNNAAAKAAGSIFGRAGAADAVQMSRSLDEFNETFERSAQTAKTFARVAETFDRLEKSAARLKEIFAPLFLGIAKYIADPLDQAITRLLQLNLAPIGEQIGSWAGLLLDSFGSGQLGEILLESIQVAMEKASFYSMKFGLTLAAIIVEAIKTAIPAGFKLGMQALTESGAESWNITDQRTIDDREKYIARVKAKEGNFKYMGEGERNQLIAKLQNERDQAEQRINDRNAGVQMARKDTISELSSNLVPSLKAAIQTVKDTYASFGDAPESAVSKSLDQRIADFRAKWEAKFKPGGKANSTTTTPEEFAPAAVRSGNIFERMGFLTNGTASTDYARKTSEHTKAISTHTERMAENFDRQSALNFHALV